MEYSYISAGRPPLVFRLRFPNKPPDSANSNPQAINAFLEGTDFTDVIANAISIGGDSDTIAAIAGSIAEVIYPIPQGLRSRVIDRMDRFLLNSIMEAVDFVMQRLPD